MKFGRTQAGIAFISITIVALVAAVDMERTSPGPLTTVHGREEALGSKKSCSECHGGWFSSMTSSCLACHEPIEEQIEAGTGLHGKVERTLAESCATCHSEHHGTGFAIVNRLSFARAGIPDPEHFDHELLGWKMDGKHLELKCAECHENADVELLPKGAQRFLGLDSNCATCHEDPHEGQMASSCASCHGQESFDQLQSLDHDRHLPLIGGHADVGCRDCHAKDSRFSLEAMTLRKGKPSPRTCVDCHASPHQTDFVDEVARMESLAAPGACVTCHAADHISFRDERLKLEPRWHSASGFDLDPPHDQVECAKCHDPATEEFLARYPGREQGLCAQCHLDPHLGQFERGPFALPPLTPRSRALVPAGAGDCSACHADEHFLPHEFDLAKHERTELPLTGEHARIECNECHQDPPANQPRVFHGTPSNCDSCHQDAHGGFFAPFAAGVPTPEHGECARCHQTESFDAVSPDDFDHGRWTGFAVKGAHEAEGCQVCHPLAPEPDEAGRTFGKVSEHFGEYQGCVTCHADPHGGAFDLAALPAAVGSRSDCARCHNEVSFRTLDQGFDHGAWTGFTLAGAHGTAACNACHTPLARPAAAGRTWERAKGQACADCHAEPHGRQFELGGKTDCARCHTDETANFLRFNHERDSRFRLGEAHKDVACSACHLPVVERGLQFIRYKPMGTECVDCHGVEEDVFLRRKPRNR